MLSILFAFLLILSCKKDSANHNQPKVVGPTVLTGTWELRRVEFSQIRNAPEWYPPGNGNITIFYDTTYKNYYVSIFGPDSGRTSTDTGTYYIKPLLNSNPELVENGDTVPALTLFTIYKDTLTLFTGDPGADGNVIQYLKID